MIYGMYYDPNNHITQTDLLKIANTKNIYNIHTYAVLKALKKALLYTKTSKQNERTISRTSYNNGDSYFQRRERGFLRRLERNDRIPIISDPVYLIAK